MLKSGNEIMKVKHFGTVPDKLEIQWDSNTSSVSYHVARHDLFSESIKVEDIHSQYFIFTAIFRVKEQDSHFMPVRAEVTCSRGLLGGELEP